MQEREELNYQSVGSLLASTTERKIKSEELVAGFLAGPCGNNFTADKDRAVLLDQIILHGKPSGSLHGIPIGLVSDKPVDYPQEKSTLEGILVGNGAVPAIYDAGNTEKKTDSSLNRFRGISAIGEAVLGNQLPLSLGIGRGWEFVLEASGLGLCSYVPSFGIVSRYGLHDDLRTNFRVGMFANFLEDLAHVGDLVSRYDSQDSLSLSYPVPSLMDFVLMDLPVLPSLCSFDLAATGFPSDYVEDFTLLSNNLETTVEQIPFPDFTDMLTKLEILLANNPEYNTIRKSLYEYMYKPGDKGPVEDKFPNPLEEAFLELGRFFERFFLDFDAIILPSSLGGDDINNKIPPINKVAEICGLPVISMPLLMDKKENPLGLLLIGKYWEDDRLFRTANWIIDEVIDSIEE